MVNLTMSLCNMFCKDACKKKKKKKKTEATFGLEKNYGENPISDVQRASSSKLNSLSKISF